MFNSMIDGPNYSVLSAAGLMLGVAITGALAAPPQHRRSGAVRLSVYECFFAAMLLGLIGVLTTFELCDLNTSQEEAATHAIEQLGGRVTFGVAADKRPTVFIDFSDSAIDDGGLVCLEMFSRVDGLNLARTKVTDAGLRQCAVLARVYEIDLSGCAVTDAAIPTLARVRGLRRLNLSGSKITDAAVAELVAISGLEELNVDGTQLTEQGLAELAGRTVGRIVRKNVPPPTERYTALQTERAERP